MEMRIFSLSRRGRNKSNVKRFCKHKIIARSKLPAVVMKPSSIIEIVHEKNRTLVIYAIKPTVYLLPTLASFACIYLT